MLRELDPEGWRPGVEPALGLNVFDFLQKPFSDDALLEAIERALGSGGGRPQ